MDKTLKARVLAVLKAVEFEGYHYIDPWESDDIERCCPMCGATDGHYDDCELAALIKELSDDNGACMTNEHKQECRDTKEDNE